MPVAKDAMGLLKADHRKIEELIEKCESARPKAGDVDLEELGERMAARKRELMTEFANSGLPAPAARNMTAKAIEHGQPIGAQGA